MQRPHAVLCKCPYILYLGDAAVSICCAPLRGRLSCRDGEIIPCRRQACPARPRSRGPAHFGDAQAGVPREGLSQEGGTRRGAASPIPITPAILRASGYWSSMGSQHRCCAMGGSLPLFFVIIINISILGGEFLYGLGR